MNYNSEDIADAMPEYYRNRWEFVRIKMPQITRDEFSLLLSVEISHHANIMASILDRVSLPDKIQNILGDLGNNMINEVETKKTGRKVDVSTIKIKKAAVEYSESNGGKARDADYDYKKDKDDIVSDLRNSFAMIFHFLDKYKKDHDKVAVVHSEFMGCLMARSIELHMIIAMNENSEKELNDLHVKFSRDLTSLVSKYRSGNKTG